MRKLLRMTILAGLMVLFGAAEDGMVFRHRFRASLNWPTADAHVVRRVLPAAPLAALTGAAIIMAAITTTSW